MLSCSLGGHRAACVVGIKYATLDSWVRTGLLPVSRPAQGKGTRRGFSFLDLVRARCVANLRAQGVSLQTIRRAVSELPERYDEQDPLARGRLVVAGDRLLWDLDDEALLDVIRGQLAARPLAILDVGEIAADTRVKVEAICAA